MNSSWANLRTRSQSSGAGRVSSAMAILDVGARSGRRELNHDLPLVPFIDFLLCIVAFLLVTAVWSHMSRLDANASATSARGVEPAEPSLELHVDMRPSERFVLTWRRGSTVVAQDEVPRRPSLPEGGVRFIELTRRIETLWNRNGLHRSAGDSSCDRAVLHTGNDARFDEIVAAMDAIAGVRRPAARGRDRPAFDVVFAAD